MRPRLAKVLLSLALAAVPLRAAEVPQLLVDINTTTPRGQLSTAQAAGFVAAGDRLLFSTSSDPNDDKGILWLTDGTAAGTRVLSSSLCPNPCPAIIPLGTWHGLALLDVTTGLWRSDGTSAGTFPLTAPLEDTSVFAPREIVSPAASNVFYFRSCQQTVGCLLWRSDGTRAGTFPLPGPDGGPSAAYPRAFTFWGGKLYFLAGVVELGLWSTDGTIKGTSRLLSVAELDQSSGTIMPTPSRLFFTAGDTSEDLWVTDGTPKGTRLVADFPPVPCFPGSGGCNEGDVSASLFALGDAVFFFANRPDFGAEIWRSDGTPEGTGPRLEMPAAQSIVDKQRVGSHWLLSVGSPSPDLILWTASDDFSHAEPLTGCDGGACPGMAQLFSRTGDGPLLFAGTDAAHGTELWITDGTGGGTHRLSDACPGACSAFGDSQAETAILGSVSGLTYFRALPGAATDPNVGEDELWVTDGTAGGTHRVVAGHVSDLGVLGGLVCFGFAGEGGTDSELWVTDGTAAGTRRLTTLQRKAPGSEPLILNHRGGALLLAWNGSSEGVWRSDGTPGGTYPVPGGEWDATRELANSMATQVGPLQFFRVNRFTDPNSADAELWRTDGTGPGTRGVASFSNQAFLDFLTPWGGKLLFLVETQAGCTFWSSDGTPESTRRILPAVPGRRCPTAVTALDGSRFLFVARVEGHGGPVPQIFLSDGTPAGTRQISALRGSRDPLEPDSPVVIGGIAFLRLPGPQYFGELEVWRSDGTPAGTFRIFKNLGEAGELFGYQGFLYFTASREPFGTRRLYRAAVQGGGSPVALAQAEPAEVPQDLTDLQFTPANRRLFFKGWDADAGFDLWVTDGTPEGTRRVRRPGSASCAPDGLVAAGNRVFFSGDDGEHGRELWESDGTPGGTRMVWDLNPGGFSSNPTNLVFDGNTVFFSADDGETGVEPWALRLEP
jgi:ELWxxDGT repeat protein